MERAAGGQIKSLAPGVLLAGADLRHLGTGLMLEMAGGLTLTIHGLTGLVAIILMLVHAAWATVVLLRKDERWIEGFHKFSVVVWLVWLVPYFSPMVLGMK